MIWADWLVRDLRHAARVLSREPGFATTAILSIALGIGVNASIFSVADGMLFRPLPYPDPGRLVLLQPYSRGNPNGTMSRDMFERIRQNARSFEAIDTVRTDFLDTLIDGGEPTRLFAFAVGSDLLPALNVRPMLGRWLAAEDYHAGGERSALVTSRLWRRLGSPPDIVGRTLTLEQRPLRVVGVMPDGFIFPVGPLGNPQPDVITPYVPDPSQPPARDARVAPPIGRLAPGVSRARAQAEVEALSAAADGNEATVRAMGLREGMFIVARPILFVLVGAAAFVLLIVCANLASVLLARGAARERELAVRRALGASRGRLAAQLGAESLMVACLGGGLGLLLADLTFDVIYAQVPGRVYRMLPAGVDRRVVLFGLCLSLVTAALVAIMPALRLSQPRLASLLQRGQGGSRGWGRGWPAGRVLVAGEVALVVLLLAGAGLMINSFVRLSAVDLGVEPEGVSTINVALPAARYPRPAAYAFYSSLLERVRALPGVEAAAGVYGLPLISIGASPLALPPSAPEGAEGEVWVVTPGYFQTFGIPLLAGRGFTEQDMVASAPVAILSRRASELGWPDGSALGLTFQNGDDRPRTIIGIAGDVRRSAMRDAVPVMYVPFDPATFRTMSLAVRMASGQPTPTAAVTARVRAMDARLYTTVGSYADAIASQSTLPRFETLVFSAFGVLGLVLAAVGIYGTVAYVVSQRTREIGIRMALGASRRVVQTMVMRQAMAPVCLGLVVGLVGAFNLTRLIEHWLFDVPPRDPATFGAVTLGLLVVAAAASFLPARRACRVDPIETLRAE
jgi:predicted permease